jgi:hypothetical protein
MKEKLLREKRSTEVIRKEWIAKSSRACEDILVERKLLMIQLKSMDSLHLMSAQAKRWTLVVKMQEKIGFGVEKKVSPDPPSRF